MQNKKFLVAREFNTGRFEKIGLAEFSPAAGISLPMDDGEKRVAVENAIRFLVAESAAAEVRTIYGYRVTRLPS